MVPRYGVAVGIALGVTFALLFIMQLLIASGRGAMTNERTARIIDFVRVARDTPPERKQIKPEKPPEPQQPPDMPPRSADSSFDADVVVSITEPTMDGRVRLSGSGLGVVDGEYLPFVKVTPAYPRRAQEQGLEGYAVVEYTVTSLGTTRDIRLVESSSSVFDRPCMAAAEKFKYRPRTVNGQTIEVPGVRNLCTFALED